MLAKINARSATLCLLSVCWFTLPFFSQCAIAQTAPIDSGRVQSAVTERQPSADLGDGYYRNPVVSGNYADPSLVRIGSDYYMVHSGGQARGLLVWHSRDLVNWTPFTWIHTGIKAAIWAPELVYYKNLFYLYLPVIERAPQGGHRPANYVLTAKSIKGPWSKAIDLHVYGVIDPGHVVDGHGNRYLYFSGGHVVPLSRNGLHATGGLRKVYDGWPFPADWLEQCFCLESPKLVLRNKFYYLVSAEGGTTGPSTSHMVVVARSASPLGPWENSPYNPLLRTRIHMERWWSQGHGTLIEDTAGKWWVVYHGIENGYRSLGRQTLLMPVAWTPDGWPRVAGQLSPAGIIRKPAGEDIGNGMPLSDDFDSTHLGLQWNYRWVPNPSETFQPEGGELRMRARGSSVDDAAMLMMQPVNRAYEAQVEVEYPDNVEAGLVFLTRERNFTGAGVKNGQTFMYLESRVSRRAKWNSNRIFLRLLDLNNDIAVFYSPNGKHWLKFDMGAELDGVPNVRVGLYAAGTGTVIFRRFSYHGLD